MIKIEYWTFDNHKIIYEACNPISVSTLEYVAKQYIAATRELPSKIYLGLNQYESLTSSMFHQNPASAPFSSEKLFWCVNLITCGVVQLVPVLKPNNDFVMVGQDKDYARYMTDEIFEKEVLS